MRTTRAITNACFIRRTTPMSASSGKWLGALSSFSNLLLEATVICPNAKKNASHTIIQQRQYHSRRYLSNEKKIAEDTTTTTTTTTTNDMESMTITIQEPDKVEEKEGPEIDRSKYTHVVKFKLPDMDQGDGKVTKWYKAEGDLIHRKETICEIELEAFSFSIDSDDEGITIMGEIFVPAGNEEPVKPGTVLCTILHPEETTKAN